MVKRIQFEFWATPKWIMEMHQISLQARNVYGILFTRMNGENEAWPGQENISSTLGISVRSVKRYVAELRRAGLIEVKKGGPGETNTYIMTGHFGTSRGDMDGTSMGTPAAPHIDVEKNSRKEQGEENVAQARPLTPAEEAAAFFARPELQASIIGNLISTGWPEQLARNEVAKFCSYWSELTRSGKKRRWETERTFEVRRRLATWLNRVREYGRAPSQKGGVVL